MNIYLIVSGKSAGLSDRQMKKLQNLGEVITVSHKGKLKEIIQLVRDPNEKVLAVDPDSFEWNLDSDTLDTIPNVKAIIAQSTSFDWIKPKELKEKGIVACNCPGYSTDSVAEYAICMAIEAARRLPIHMKNGGKIDWNVKPMLLKGKTVGILGLGKIGKRMAEIAQGIGMNVVYWSKKSRDSRFTYSQLSDLFGTVDVLMPALVETDETRNIITKQMIDSLKPSAIIVGINRVKALLPEEHILAKVAEGKLGGYAFEGDNTKTLTSYSGNVWALPAIAWYTQDSLQNSLHVWVDDIVSFVQGKPQNVVNP